jgi:hypothetical protein
MHRAHRLQLQDSSASGWTGQPSPCSRIKPFGHRRDLLPGAKPRADRSYAKASLKQPLKRFSPECGKAQQRDQSHH